MDRLRAVYRLSVDRAEVEARADALALEQTVELPRAAIRDPVLEREALGRVEGLEPHPAGGFRVVVEYPVAATGVEDPAQLLNVLFGNASLQGDVALEDVDLPPSLAAALGGPGHGIQGVRAATGVRDRPLTCAALKPMGLNPEAIGEVCLAFARAGVDVVKDDHGLADIPRCPFEARLAACRSAIERAAEETGRRALYVANVIGPPARIRRLLRMAEEGGAGGVLMAPFVIGLPTFREACRDWTELPVIAHPALAGSPRVATELLQGTLFRLYGADAVVFPHAGGRFPIGRETCRALTHRLRRPWEGVRPALPVPAGGMSLERIEEMIAFYGTDTMLLVGGTLYRTDELEARARSFVERVRAAARATEWAG